MTAKGNGDRHAVIKLDASGWTNLSDFYDAALAALKAPHWHGKSIDALIDSMVFGGINGIEPPYTLRIENVSRASSAVQEELEKLRSFFPVARQEYLELKGHVREVDLSLCL